MAGVSQAIEEYCNKTFSYGAHVEVVRSLAQYYGEGQELPQYIWLSKTPIEDGTLTVLYHPRGKWSEARVLDAGDYDLDRDEGLLRIFGGESSSFSTIEFESSARGFQVSYTGGYAEQDALGWPHLVVPEALRIAAAMQTSFLFTNMTRGSLGLEVANGDSKSPTKMKPLDGPDYLIPEVRSLLAPHVKKGLAGKAL